MDTAPWPHPQELVVKPMEEIISNTTTTTTSAANNNTIKPQPSTSLERKVRPQKDQAVNCPRCNSTNTKFCYYNNYSLTQPRYFCKGCRRYWTEGGSLRNIPVGGGSRKNKRPSSSSVSSSSATSKIRLSDHHHHHHQFNHVLPTNPNHPHHPHHHKIHMEAQDLNLGFPSTLSEFMQLPNMETQSSPHHQFHQKSTNHMMNQTPNNPSNTSHLSALELLTGLTSSSRGLMTPFMPMQIQDPNSVYQTGFSMQGDHFKPTLNFSLDGLHGVQESGDNNNNNSIGGRVLFPFEDLKSTTTTATTTTTTADHDQHQNHNGDQQITRNHQHQHQHQHQHGDSTGYWTGMLGGAGSWCLPPSHSLLTSIIQRDSSSHQP